MFFTPFYKYIYGLLRTFPDCLVLKKYIFAGLLWTVPDTRTI